MFSKQWEYKPFQLYIFNFLLLIIQNFWRRYDTSATSDKMARSWNVIWSYSRNMQMLLKFFKSNTVMWLSREIDDIFGFLVYDDKKWTTETKYINVCTKM
jgi:hypothetical protein